MTTRDHGRILCKIWQDKDFRALPRSAQAMYMQLLSQAGVNNAGVLPLQVSKWVKGCDEITTEGVWSDLGVLSKRGFIVVDDDTEEVLIRSFIRNDGGMAHKYIFKNALRCAEAVESSTLRKALAIELLRLRRPDAAAVADILAPSEPESNAEVIPSEWDSDPIENPSESEMAFGPDSNHWGVGEGEGVGETLVVGHLGGVAHTHGRAASAREEPPNPHCPKHPGGTAENCGACAGARKQRERYDAEATRQAERETAAKAEAERRRALQGAEDRAAAIRACPMCDETGWADGRTCDHDPGSAERDRRGIARAKIAICRLCDDDGFRADGTRCDHKLPRRGALTPVRDISPVTDLSPVTDTDSGIERKAAGQ